MNKILGFFTANKKAFFIIGIVALVLALIWFLSFWAMKSYLEKNVYQDISLIYYEEALSAMDNSWASVPAKIFVFLANKAYPDLFIRYISPEERLEAFDYTKEPATFKILSADSTTKTLSLEPIFPKVLEGVAEDVIVRCSTAKTQAFEMTKEARIALEKAFQSGDYSGIEKFISESSFKKLELNKPVFEFIADLLNREDVKNGSKTIELEAKCGSFDCDYVGEDCAITIVGN